MGLRQGIWLCIFMLTPPVWGDTPPQDGSDHLSDVFAPDRDVQRPRNTFGPPLLSFFLPGFDQWWEGQYAAATAYTGLALGAGAYTAYNKVKLEDERLYEGYGDFPDEKKENRLMQGERERKIIYGSQLEMASGSLSAYHSFRTAVRSQQMVGNYEFLRHEEAPGDLLAAPFHFSYLSRPTTYVPIGVIVLYHALAMRSDLEHDKTYRRDPLMPSDSFFAGAISYNAGVHEEALFRGWLMPVFREWSGSDWMSNAGTTTLFALAHLPSTPMPVLQALLGWHLGYVTQRNQWTISESIFIHTWWDVFSLLTQYQIKKRVPGEALSVLWLPPLKMQF